MRVGKVFVSLLLCSLSASSEGYNNIGVFTDTPAGLPANKTAIGGLRLDFSAGRVPEVVFGLDVVPTRIVVRNGSYTAPDEWEVCGGGAPACAATNVLQATANFNITDSQQVDILRGNWLAVIMTALFPNGELMANFRWQIGARFGVFTGPQVPSPSLGLGVGLLLPSKDAAIRYYIYHNFPDGDVTLISLFIGPPGDVGPVFSLNQPFPFGNTSANFDSPVVGISTNWNDEDLVKYMRASLYSTMYTSAHPYPVSGIGSGGAIRGQLEEVQEANETLSRQRELEETTVIGEPEPVPKTIQLFRVEPGFSKLGGNVQVTIHGKHLPNRKSIIIELGGQDITSTIVSGSLGLAGTSVKFVAPPVTQFGGEGVYRLTVKNQKYPEVQTTALSDGEVVDFLSFSYSSCGGTTYKPEGSDECLKCPTGAICKGGPVMWPQPGYWSASTTDVPSACSSEEQCLGGENSECGEGYTGFKCAECAPGYYVQNSLCRQCEGGAVSTAILSIAMAAFFAVFIVCIFTFRDDMLSNVLAAISNLQVLSGVGKMVTANIPGFLRDLYGYLTIFNFDYTFLKADCGGGAEASSFVVQFMVSLSFFFIPTAIIVAGLRVLAHLKEVKATTDMIKDEARKEQAGWYTARSLRGVFLLALLQYFNLSYVSLLSFNCVNVSGKLVLLYDPRLTCFKGTHVLVFAVALLVVCSLVIGLPVLVIVRFFHYKKTGLLYDSHVLAKYGVIYEDYRKSKVYFAFLSFIIPLMLASLAALLPNEQEIQGWISNAALLLFFVIYIFIQPYDAIFDNLSAAFTVGLAMCASFLNTVSSGEQTRVKQDFAYYTSWLVVILSAVVLLLSIYPFLAALKERRNEKRKVAPNEYEMKDEKADVGVVSDNALLSSSSNTSLKQRRPILKDAA